MQVTRVAPDRPVPSLMHGRRVMADRITYVGLDVHKESIVVSVAEGGLRGEVREYGRIANTALNSAILGPRFRASSVMGACYANEGLQGHPANRRDGLRPCR